MEAKWHCHRRRRSLQRRQAVPFRQESPVTPRLPLHPYGFRDKSLREGNSSPLSKTFGKNLNMNTPNDLITVKNNSMRSFMRNLVAMRQMKTKLRSLKPHRPYKVDFAIDARESVSKEVLELGRSGLRGTFANGSMLD